MVRKGIILNSLAVLALVLLGRSTAFAAGSASDTCAKEKRDDIRSYSKIQEACESAKQARNNLVSDKPACESAYKVMKEKSTAYLNAADSFCSSVMRTFNCSGTNAQIFQCMAKAHSAAADQEDKLAQLLKEAKESIDKYEKANQEAVQKTEADARRITTASLSANNLTDKQTLKGNVGAISDDPNQIITAAQKTAQNNEQAAEKAKAFKDLTSSISENHEWMANHHRQVAAENLQKLAGLGPVENSSSGEGNKTAGNSSGSSSSNENSSSGTSAGSAAGAAAGAAGAAAGAGAASPAASNIGASSGASRANKNLSASLVDQNNSSVKTSASNKPIKNDTVLPSTHADLSGGGLSSSSSALKENSRVSSYKNSGASKMGGTNTSSSQQGSGGTNTPLASRNAKSNTNANNETADFGAPNLDSNGMGLNGSDVASSMNDLLGDVNALGGEIAHSEAETNALSSNLDMDAADRTLASMQEASIHVIQDENSKPLFARIRSTLVKKLQSGNLMYGTPDK